MKKLLLVAAVIFAAGCYESNLPRPVSFTLPSATTGEDWNSKDYRGKPIFIAVLSTMCGYCRMSLPQINKLNEEYKDKGVVVLGMFADRTPENLKRFISGNDLNFEVLYNGGPLFQDMGVEGVPHFVLLDKNHIPYRMWSAYSSNHGFEAAIDKILGE